MSVNDLPFILMVLSVLVILGLALKAAFHK